MANTTRSSNLFAAEDWTKVYESFKEINFQSYDFQTIRKSMVDYLQTYYPEDFNDYIESSEYIALIDLIAYIAQSINFRTDLNARENFLETAERRDSILRLAKMLNYHPKRTQVARGLLKVESVQTTEVLLDSNSNNLDNTEIYWGDETNPDFLEQFITIMNASFVKTERFGDPALRTSIAGITAEEYSISIVPGTTPVYEFSSNVAGNRFDFELINGTYSGTDFLYEVPPTPTSTFNTIYRNDAKGFNSVDTGFFFYFKQGNLQTIDFTVDDALPNRTVDIDVNSIDNNDVWLYELDSNGVEKTLWTKVPSITGNNVIFNSLSDNVKTLFTVQSRQADKVSLVFGDGVFSKIPVGSYRAYYRTGNGFTYKISPNDMSNVTLTIPYVSHSGQTETLTINTGLEYTVSNASARESLNDIKAKAQQQYYTQQRMVTGEDYQIFPFTSYNSVLKSKAINRTSSGVSRYLDARDTTGKYSSTNIVAEDGIFYRENQLKSFDFNFITTSDINAVLSKQVEPVIKNKESLHFFLDQFEQVDVTDLSTTWNRTTISTGSVTGYFNNTSNNPATVGRFAGNNLKFIIENSLLKFIAPDGFVFDVNNNLVTGTPGTLNTRSYLWASVVNVVDDGTNQGVGNLDTGFGPVTLSENIPDSAKLEKIIAPFNTVFRSDLRASIIDAISNYKTFALRYDYNTQAWAMIYATNLNQSETFSTQYSGNIDNLNLDNSWLFKFINDGTTYSVTHRSLSYVFESVLETRFYYDKDLKIFDPRTNRTVRDKVVILKVNTAPDSDTSLMHNYEMNVDSAVIESDGFVLSEKIKVTFPDSDSDNIIDDPDVFNVIVQPDVNTKSKVVFYEKYLDNSGYERYKPVKMSSIESTYDTLAELQAIKDNYSAGQIFYATDTFYVLSVNSALEKILTETTDYKTYTGRGDLLFQYTHNAPNNRRIDPSPSNIIDLFMLTKTYDTDYRNWAQDLTGAVSKPTKPTVLELRNSFGELEKYKTLSDAIILNSVSYRPLFGDKAEGEFQATFKVVKNTATLISDSAVKAKVVNVINDYFALENWDFGDTFYFSELSAYLHNVLAPDVLSVIIVPKSSDSVFGSLFQIQSIRDEIFISTATVQDIEVIDVITASQLQSGGNVINTTEDIGKVESISAGSSSTTVQTSSNELNSIRTTKNGGYSY